MDLPSVTKRQLFIYASPEEFQSRPDRAPFAARLGGSSYEPERRAFVLELDNAAEREALRVDLLAAGIPVSHAPLSAKTESVWRGFLSGTRRRVSPAPLALLFGPVWYLYHGLFAKFWLLASAAGATRFLDWLGDGWWGTTAGLEVDLFGQRGRVGVVQLALLFLLLFLYPCLLGRWDCYLQQARGERFWPGLPYKNYKGMVWGAAVIGLVCWIAGSTVGAGNHVSIHVTEKGGAKTTILEVEGFFKRRRGEIWLGKAKPEELLAKWMKDVEAGYLAADVFWWHHQRFRAKTPHDIYCLNEIPSGRKEFKLRFAGHPQAAAVDATSYGNACVVPDVRRPSDGAPEVYALALVIHVDNVPPARWMEARLSSASAPEVGTVGEFQAGGIQGRRYRHYAQTTTAGGKSRTVLGDAYVVDVGEGTSVGMLVWFSGSSEADVDGFVRETLSTLTAASR